MTTRAQAVAAGLSAAEIDALVRSRRWTALRRGIYWPAAQLPDEPTGCAAVHLQAAVLATRVRSVGSHESAALVHGLPLFVPYKGSPLVSRVREAGRVRPAAVSAARLVSQVPPEQVVKVQGASVTSLARTAVDLARTRSALTAVIVLDAVLARRVSEEQLVAVLDSQRGWPGSALARSRVAFADGRAESPLESIGRLRFAQLELPAPELQVVLGGDRRPVGRVDFLFRAHGTVAEADGRLKYEGQPVDGRPSTPLWDEKLREDDVRDAGFEVFRFGWDDAVHRPEVLRARAVRAFARAARAGRHARMSARSDSSDVV